MTTTNVVALRDYSPCPTCGELIHEVLGCIPCEQAQQVGRETGFDFSVGRTRYDNKPEQQRAATWTAFGQALWEQLSPTKGLRYFCAPFAVGAHNNPDKYRGPATWRQKHLVGARNWIALDVDRLAGPGAFAELCARVASFDTYGYTTYTSTLEAPRCRLIVRTSRPMTREESIAVGEVLQAEITTLLGADRITFDSSVLRGEQPVYTPTVNAIRFDTRGDALDVDAYLAKAVRSASPAATKPPKSTEKARELVSSTQQRAAAIASGDPIYRRLEEQGRVKRDLGGGRIAIICPFASEHTTESSESSTVYMLPHFNGVPVGNFNCLHDHCAERTQGDFIQAVGLDPVAVRATQRPVDRFAFGNLAGAEAGSHSLPNIVAWSEFVQQLGPPDYVVHRVFQRGHLYALTAMWGAGKTAIMITIVIHVAVGRDLHGHRVQQGRVLYLCGENPADVRLRAVAAARELGIDGPLDVFFTRIPFAIDDPAARKAFIEEVAPFGLFDMAVIDTGPAHSHADDENDNRSSHEFAMSMRELMAPLGNPATVVLMHPPKSATRDTLAPRGGGAFSGSIDGELACWQEPKGVVEFFHRPKFRGPGFESIFFELRRYVFSDLTDNFEEPATTVVAVPCNPPGRARAKPLTGAKRVAVEALRECRNDRAGPPPVSLAKALGHQAPALVVPEDEWRARCFSMGISDGGDSAKAKAFRRSRNELLDTKVIGVRDGLCWLPEWVWAADLEVEP